MPMVRPFGHGKPTAKQVRAWETVERTGSQIAAVRELGITQAAVQSLLAGYMRAMGMTGRPPGASRHVTGSGAVGRLRAVIAERDGTIYDLTQQLRSQEAANAALMEQVAALQEQAHPWVSVHAKLDALLRRPTGPAPITHRRRADGGQGGKHERKAAA